MKTKNLIFILLLPALLICTAMTAHAADWLLYGTVRWDSKTTAASVSVRLMQDKKVKKVVYTNPQGRYGFYGLPGKPGDYSLEIWFDNKLFKSIDQQETESLARGSRLDIRLQRQ